MLVIIIGFQGRKPVSFCLIVLLRKYTPRVFTEEDVQFQWTKVKELYVDMADSGLKEGHTYDTVIRNTRSMSVVDGKEIEKSN